MFAANQPTRCSLELTFVVKISIISFVGLTVDIVRQAQAEFKQYCVANDGKELKLQYCV